MKEWADEYKVLFRGPESHPNRNFTRLHIPIGPIDHIIVIFGVARMENLGNYYYTFVTEPKSSVYHRLLESAGVFANYAQLVIRHTIPLDTKGRTALEKLQPFLISQKESSEWPGTKLFDSTATVLRYRLEPLCINTLLGLSDNLYDWKQPELPEDLCFLREDGSPWFGSISHEGDSFFMLSDYEYSELIKQFPIFLTMISKDENIKNN